MEGSNKIIQRCYICDQQVLMLGKNIFTTSTNHSRTLMINLLENMVDRKLVKTSDFCLGCAECIGKINEYDLAVVKAQEVQEYLVQLLRQTEEKYLQNVVLFCDQPRDNSDGKLHESGDDDQEFKMEVKVEEPEFRIDKSLEQLRSDGKAYEIHFVSTELDAEKTGEAVNLEDQTYETVYTLQEMEDSVAKKVDDDAEIKDKAVDEELKQNEISISCEICEKIFDTVQQLQRHARKHNCFEKFMCDVCGAGYKTKSALEVHVRTHTGYSPFVCEVCGKKFTQKGALTRHRPIHTGERPYQCDKCGKQFIHYSSFHMHKLAHDDIREKKCDVCGMLLRSTSHLNRHMLVHTGLKPHECPKCGQRFAQRYNMTSHLKSHQGIHRAKKYPCTKCRKAFHKEEKLLEHIALDSCTTPESTILLELDVTNDDDIKIFDIASNTS